MNAIKGDSGLLGFDAMYITIQVEAFGGSTVSILREFHKEHR
jgi:hypothetical protein